MPTYLIRRLLLMFPTLLGVTAVVFFVMAYSPGGIGDVFDQREGGLRPEERRVMQAYYTERYGLDKPKVVQYLKWLNHVSPIGFKSGEGFPVPGPSGSSGPTSARASARTARYRKCSPRRCLSRCCSNYCRCR